MHVIHNIIAKDANTPQKLGNGYTKSGHSKKQVDPYQLPIGSDPPRNRWSKRAGFMLCGILGPDLHAMIFSLLPSPSFHIASRPEPQHEHRA